MTNLSNPQIYYPNSSGFLGNYSGSNPNSSNGQWWYRTDTGQILQNINGNIIPVTTAPNTLIISSNQTIGSISVPTVVEQNIIVMPNITLTILGTITFEGTVTVLQGGTLLSSNPQASSGPVNNYYYFLQSFYLNGTYSIASNNIDVFSYSQTITTISGPSSSTITGSGTFHIPNGITATVNANVNISVGSVAGKGTLSISSGYTITVNSNSSFSIATVSGSGSLVISPSYVLTFSGSNLLPSVLTANGTLALSGNYTLATNITNGTGNIQVNGGYVLTVGSSLTLGFSSVSGAGTLSVSSTYTLTIGANTTLSIATISGAGTIAFGANTITINGNETWSITGMSGTGTLTINSGYTLTLGASYTFDFGTVSGAGTLYVASTYTLTQGAAITLSIANISVAGTWANAGYGITVPSGSTVSWNVSGSITTATTAGTLTVNGTCYWIGSGITPATSNAQATFTLTLAGTGVFIGSPAGKGTATTAVALSATAIAAGAGDGSAAGTGYIPYYSFSSQAIQGSAVGKYTIGTENTTAATYQGFVLIYIGTAATNFTVSGNFGYTSADVSGDTIEAFNMTGSAGTITLTGDLYV